MKNLRIFVQGCLLQYRALFSWANPLAYFTYKLLVPISQLVLFSELGSFATGRSNVLYFAVGNAFQLTAINGVYGVVMTVGNERRYGTLPLLLASPANRLATFLGRSLFHVLDGMSSVLLGFLLATVLFGLNLGHANLPLLVLSVLLISVTTSGLGLLFGSLSLIMRDVLALANSVDYVLLIFCGVNVPVDRLPGVAQAVSYALPMTYGVAAGRRSIEGASLVSVAGLLTVEAAVGAVWVVVGYLLFRWLEQRSRIGGLQEAY